MSKKKILSIAIIAILFIVCVLNSTAFATNIVTIDASNTSASTGGTTGAGSITITSSSNNVVSNNTATESAANNTAVNNLTTSTNNAAKTNLVSSYNNTANKANTANGLPYTGSDSSIVFIFIAFVASAIYAYKKVRDYNV